VTVNVAATNLSEIVACREVSLISIYRQCVGPWRAFREPAADQLQGGFTLRLPNAGL